jgi:chloride channel 3/4/5
MTIDKAMRTRHLSPNATCTFNALPGDVSGSDRLSVPDIVIPGRHAGRSPNLESRPSMAEVNEVDFGQYVDVVSQIVKRLA